MAEAELVHLRQELLLMGELQIKYREKFRNPSTVARKQEELFTQAYEAQISGELKKMQRKVGSPKISKGMRSDIRLMKTRKFNFQEWRTI